MKVHKVIEYSGYDGQRESNDRHIKNTNKRKDKNIHTAFSEALKKAKQNNTFS